MKIGITLASGQLGQAIITELNKHTEANNIVAFVRNPSKAPFADIEYRKGDYDCPEDWVDSMNDIDTLILISSISDPEKRVFQHQTVIEAAKKQGIKKLIYTSIIGSDADTGFAPVVKSNRQTEEDIMKSGLPYIIGRNGLYIDADVEFIEEYKKAGCIWNSAGDGKCCYTSRNELAKAYSRLALTDNCLGKVIDLCGKAYTQKELVAALNNICDLDLVYKAISVEEFTKNRTEALGSFYGTIIGGIYESIAKGYFDVHSDFVIASGHEHQTLNEMIHSELQRLEQK